MRKIRMFEELQKRSRAFMKNPGNKDIKETGTEMDIHFRPVLVVQFYLITGITTFRL